MTASVRRHFGNAWVEQVNTFGKDPEVPALKVTNQRFLQPTVRRNAPQLASKPAPEVVNEFSIGRDLGRIAALMGDLLLLAASRWNSPDALLRLSVDRVINPSAVRRPDRNYPSHCS